MERRRGTTGNEAFLKINRMASLLYFFLLYFFVKDRAAFDSWTTRGGNYPECHPTSIRAMETLSLNFFRLASFFLGEFNKNQRKGNTV